MKRIEQHCRSLQTPSGSLTTREKTNTRSKLVFWFLPGYASILLATTVAIVALGATRATGEPQETNTKAFFLVASRDMPDPVFQQSVILMLPPDEPPLVAGVIINKPTDVTLGKLLKQPLAPASRSQRIYFGGPVELATPLLVIRTATAPKGVLQLGGNVYAVTDPSAIRQVLSDARYGSEMRLFLGRAQWAQEQLRGELLQGAWSVVPLRTELLFERDSAKVWRILSQHEHVREIDVQRWATGRLAAKRCAEPTAGAFQLWSATPPLWLAADHLSRNKNVAVVCP